MKPGLAIALLAVGFTAGGVGGVWFAPTFYRLTSHATAPAMTTEQCLAAIASADAGAKTQAREFYAGVEFARDTDQRAQLFVDPEGNVVVIGELAPQRAEPQLPQHRDVMRYVQRADGHLQYVFELPRERGSNARFEDAWRAASGLTSICVAYS